LRELLMCGCYSISTALELFIHSTTFVVDRNFVQKTEKSGIMPADV